MKKILNIALLFTVITIQCSAQIGFESIGIYQLYEKLPQSIKSEIENDISGSQNSEVNIQTVWDGKILAYSCENNILNQVGIKIPGINIEGEFEKSIISFIERALLRLSFENSIQDLVSGAETMQLRISFQDQNLIFSTILDFNELFNIINSSNQFVLSANSDFMLAEWVCDLGSLKFLFPNNYQLVTGKNKKELDEDLLSEFYDICVDTASVMPSSVIESINDSLPVLIENGSNYLNRMSSDVYYKYNGKDSILVFDQKIIPYSVSNLFLTNQLAGKRSLNLNEKLYGGRSVPVNLYLQKFISFLKNDFDAFCGLENTVPELIEGTVVFRHKYFNFIHLMYFKTNATEIFNDSGKITADFYPNIPMHNVSNLFSDIRQDFNSPIMNVKIK